MNIDGFNVDRTPLFYVFKNGKLITKPIDFHSQGYDPFDFETLSRKFIRILDSV